MPDRMWQRGPHGEILRRKPDAAVRGDDPGAAPAPVREQRRRASIVLALRLGARDTYDHLGMVLFMSAVWSVAGAAGALGGQAAALVFAGGLPGALPAVLGGLGAALGLALAGGPLAAGMFRYCRNAAARREPEIFDLAWGFRHALGRSIGLALAQVMMAVILGGNAYFYFSLRHPVAAVLGATFAYTLLFWGTMCLVGWPLLAHEEDAGAASVGRVLKKSALLVLDNFAYSAALAVLVLLLTAGLWLTMVGGVLLWAGALAMILTQAGRELLRKYALLPPDPTLDPISDEMEAS